ncbi:hypothetical protein L1887_36093 [Cichorium endivia]|nr:hypothetical protein L1887_36093 [Cichorium endivia]
MSVLRLCKGIKPNVSPKTTSGYLTSLGLSSLACWNQEPLDSTLPSSSPKFIFQGKWIKSANWNTIVDPLNGESFIKVSEVDASGIKPFVESLYLLYRDISAKAGHMLALPEVSDFFAKLVQRVAPKSYHKALGEVYVTGKFLENFSVISSWESTWPAKSWFLLALWTCSNYYAFQFPFEDSSTPIDRRTLYNKHVLKVDSKVCIIMEQMLRLLHDCGMPLDDVDFINSDGKTMNKLLLKGKPRMTLFTGSSKVANKLADDLNSRIKLEDAGFDWKILGPDVLHEVDYVLWVCDQDAYACSGQKCSAQSMLFMHEAMNWLLSHMDDPDIDAPINKESGKNDVDPSKIATLVSFGFEEEIAKKALKASVV